MLKVKSISCFYNQQKIVNNLSFEVEKGSFTCLLGPSGCGKTTVLRAIAGLESIHEGEIALNGKSVSTKTKLIAPNQRNLGMVFQDNALFPHMTLFDNIGFSIRNQSQEEKKITVDELLKTIGLEGFAERYPHEISGGQQQRVALARAIAAKPDLLLLDEPFSNLDIDLRERLGLELREILIKHKITALMVTHDQHEAFALGDQIGIMNQGKIEQWDTPFNLYHEPINRFVATFVGQSAFLPGILIAQDTVKTELGPIQGSRYYAWDRGTIVDVLIRPDDIIPNPHSLLKGNITHKAFKGAEVLYTIALPSGDKVYSLFPSHQNYDIGANVGIEAAADHLVIFKQITT